MDTDNGIMDQVKHYAKEFVERQYPDEAPYFSIAWEAYVKAHQSSRNIDHRSGSSRHTADSRRSALRNLKGPTVRGSRRSALNLDGDNIIMGPRVIRAFHILITMMEQRTESENSENLKQEMLQLLLQEKFSHEFSMKIVDFYMENRGNQ